MCIGVAMQVLETASGPTTTSSAPRGGLSSPAQPDLLRRDASFAWCSCGEQRERLDMVLVGDQPPGTWVLAFLGVARRILTEQEAAQSSAARQALDAVRSGDAQLDRFFADLVGREPVLPAHLLPAGSQQGQ